jgi:integrase
LDADEIGDVNPTRGVKRLYEVQHEHEPWTDHVIAAFDRKAPPHLKLARLRGYYTGQRVSDLVTMQWSQFDGRRIELPQQEKTGEFVSVPCNKVLRTALEAEVRRANTVLTNQYGKPYASPKTLGQAFRRVLRKIGAKDYSIHGLRKNAAKALAEAGCSEREIMAVIGHRSPAMVSLCTKRAEKKRRTRSAIEKWENDDGRRWTTTESGNPER